MGHVVSKSWLVSLHVSEGLTLGPVGLFIVRGLEFAYRCCAHWFWGLVTLRYRTRCMVVYWRLQQVPEACRFVHSDAVRQV